MRSPTVSPASILRLAFILALCVPVMTGCTVKFISDYDQVFDNSITALHIDTEMFLAHLESTAGTPDASYDANKNFYVDAKARLETFRMRAEATPKNEITAEQIGLLIDSFDTLRQLHETGGSTGLTATQLAPVHTSLEVSFRSIITLEIAKKRGKE